MTTTMAMTMKHMTKRGNGANENQREEEDEGEEKMQGEQWLISQRHKSKKFKVDEEK